ncbi:unnamed protein product [Ceutorhynchus assimilis]|uniref:Uncharacterized protein n=1 Tax=Ceutorhynchus assimilis TaxID=467358 RepID=A0A9N9QMP7_9CUCU|nr:unnamed protein product [Ceutorhynchus assimilis]
MPFQSRASVQFRATCIEPLLLPLAIPTTDAFPPPGFFYKTSEHGQEQ